MKYSERNTGYIMGRYKYDMETGSVSNLLTGQDIGSIGQSGYVLVGITLPNQKPMLYRAHMMAWLLMTGEWPAEGFQVDHKDRDKANNRWSNLRLVSARLNSLNRSNVSTACPYTVVSWKHDFKKWAVFIGPEAPDVYSKRGFCGFFDTDNDAMAYVDTLLEVTNFPQL